MTSAEKLEVARSLARLGVDVIEAGFPAASPDDLEAVRRIAIEVGNPPVDRLRCAIPQSSAAWRAPPKEISIKPGKLCSRPPHPRIHTFLATSDIHMQHKLHMSRHQVMETVGDMVAYARSLCKDIEFSPEDASRSDPEFLYQVLSDSHPGRGNHSEYPGYGRVHHAGRIWCTDRRDYQKYPRYRELLSSLSTVTMILGWRPPIPWQAFTPVRARRK